MTKILPVIHVQDKKQTTEEVYKAFNRNVDGVFLVNHDHNWEHFQEVFGEVRQAFPDFWIGVNCLDLHSHEVFAAFSEADGIWVDNACIDEREDEQHLAGLISATGESYGGLYFGGVAFKYQRDVQDVSTAASIACDYMDVVTTSGPATGKSADPEKVRRMKSAMGDHPLAIASGITPDNVAAFLPYVDYILCATGISKDFHHLDSDKIKQLVEKVRSNE